MCCAEADARVSLAPDLDVARRWADVFSREGVRSLSALLARAEVVRDLPSRQNLVVRLGGHVLYVKRRKPSPATRRLREHPEEAGRRLAAALGVPVAEGVFAGRAAKLGLLSGALDVRPARPLDDLLREGRVPPRVRRRLSRRLAAAVAALHAGRLHHRDLYLNHVWVDPDAEDPLVAILDWERLRAHRRRLGRWVVKDLASLLASTPDGTVSRAELLRFVASYLRGLGAIPSRRCVRRLLRRVEGKASRIRSHRPRTPVGEAARPRSAG